MPNAESFATEGRDHMLGGRRQELQAAAPSEFLKEHPIKAMTTSAVMPGHATAGYGVRCRNLESFTKLTSQLEVRPERLPPSRGSPRLNGWLRCCRQAILSNATRSASISAVQRSLKGFRSSVGLSYVFFGAFGHV